MDSMTSYLHWEPFSLPVVEILRELETSLVKTSKLTLYCGFHSDSVHLSVVISKN
jgi:hypothetical protein